MSYYNNKFSNRLKELMAEKSVNTIQLQKTTNITNQAISLWLAEKREPKLYYLWVLADYFNCSIDYLVGRTDD